VRRAFIIQAIVAGGVTIQQEFRKMRIGRIPSKHNRPRTVLATLSGADFFELTNCPVHPNLGRKEVAVRVSQIIIPIIRA
jgi:hypothetical protein